MTKKTEKIYFNPQLTFLDNVIVVLLCLVIGGIGIYAAILKNVYIPVIAAVFMIPFVSIADIAFNSETNYYSKFDVKVFKLCIKFIKFIKFLVIPGLIIYLFLSLINFFQTANSSKIIIFLLLVIIGLLLYKRKI